MFNPKRIRKKMGYDYLCPDCGGPAYKSSYHTTDSPCDACRRGLPTRYTCSWCSQDVVSTTRYGGEKCETYGCQKMICDSCSRGHVGPQRISCKRCHEENRTPQEELIELEAELASLLERIAKVKRKIEMGDTNDINEETECSCRLGTRCAYCSWY